MSSLLDDVVRASRFASPLLLGTALAVPLAWSDEPRLRAGQPPVAGQLQGNEERAYPVALRRGEILALEVMQDGIDVVVEVQDPQGKVALQVDSPNGVHGPEPVLLLADETGDYRVRVRALDPMAAAGRYTLDNVAIREATARDRDLVEAVQLVGRSYALRSEMKQAAAVSLAERALALRETRLGAEDLGVADVLTLLGLLYDEVADYRRGAEVFARALAIRERRLPADDATVVDTTSNLGYLRLALGDYDGAETLFLKALAGRERRGEPEQAPFTGLAALSRDRGDTERARQFRARATRQRDTPGGRLALGQLEMDERRPAQAEALCEQARAGAEGGRGFAVWTLASSLECLGVARFAQGRAAEAEADLRRSLKVREDVSGPEHPYVAASLTELARVLAAKDPEGARALLDRALAIRERRMLPNHLDIAATLLARGDLDRAAGRAPEAEASYRRALSIYDASAPKHRNRERARLGLDAVVTPSSPAAVAARLMDAWNAYDSDRAKALYTPDAVTVRRETRSPVNHEASRGYRAYEAVTAARFRYTVLEATDHYAEIEFTEETDFLRAIGIAGVTARWRYVVENGLIREEHHLTRADPGMVAALRAFDAWVAAERPGRSQEIRHANGNLRFDAASAPVLLGLAREWDAAGRP